MDPLYKRTVSWQIAAGLLLIPCIGGVLWVVLPEFREGVRLRVVFGSLALVAIPLVAGIQLMLFRRFNSPELIRGRIATETLSIREIYLSNTQEQSVLAAGAVLASGFLVPESLLKLPLIGAILFLVGRAAYYFGYARDPMRRFVGFVVGHYSSITLLFAALYYALAGT